jgi:hypothetical protein
MGLLPPGSRRTYGSATFALRAMSFIPGLPIPRGYSLSSLVGRSTLTMIASIAVPPGSFSSSHRDSQPGLDRKATRTVVENVSASKHAPINRIQGTAAMNSRLVLSGLHHQYVCICVSGHNGS